MKKILIVQTAFIGDVILATPLIEKAAFLYPGAKIDFLLRKGNEGLLFEHPKLNKVIVWDKRKNKYLNFLKIMLDIRRSKYDLLINVHRFATSGLLTWLSGAKMKVGFDKNPFSFSYNQRIEHEINNGKHEVTRNLELLNFSGDPSQFKPKLYFSEADQRKINDLISGPYATLAPASVWFTKQLPKTKWVELIGKIPTDLPVCLIGAANDLKFCEEIILESGRENALNLAGKLSILESVALMNGALMNFVNDSAPMHLASSVNAPTTAFFCSTIPDFGFGPLSAQSKILENTDHLPCRPCGLHGKKQCPEGHFKCGYDLSIPDEVMKTQ